MEASDGIKEIQLAQKSSSASIGLGSSMRSSSGTYGKSKRVWVWTESKQVMTASVERGWNTFIFSSRSRELADEWSCKLIQTSLVYTFLGFSGSCFIELKFFALINEDFNKCKNFTITGVPNWKFWMNLTLL